MTKENRELAEWLAGLGDETRLAVLKILATGSKNVTETAKLLNVEIVNVSHHYGVLRAAKLVNSEKVGRFVIYTLADGIEVKDGTLVLTHKPTLTMVGIPLH